MLFKLVSILYLAASLAALGAYGLDKRAARRGRRRTPERTLHTIELVGGWPGGILARRLFRHKTSKRSFLLVSRLIIALHAVVWAAVLWSVLA